MDILSKKLDILEFFGKWIFSFYFGNIESQRTANIQIRANGSLEQKIKNINSFWKSIKLSRWFLFWRLVILPTMTSSVSIMILPVIGTSSVHLNRGADIISNHLKIGHNINYIIFGHSIGHFWLMSHHRRARKGWFS